MWSCPYVHKTAAFLPCIQRYFTSSKPVADYTMLHPVPILATAARTAPSRDKIMLFVEVVEGLYFVFSEAIASDWLMGMASLCQDKENTGRSATVYANFMQMLKKICYPSWKGSIVYTLGRLLTCTAFQMREGGHTTSKFFWKPSS